MSERSELSENFNECHRLVLGGESEWRAREGNGEPYKKWARKVSEGVSKRVSETMNKS